MRSIKKYLLRKLLGIVFVPVASAAVLAALVWAVKQKME